jgi:ornithine cyclodeaminase/alanine dehydrogenase
MRPKLALHAEGGTLFLASPGVLGKVAGVKWVGVADNRERRLPHIAGTIVLSDAATGMPLAIMDARWITQVRTAAISAVTARRLARADSAAIGFIACGVQARAHLSALRRHFRLTRVRAYSRSLRTAEAFAAEARAQGLEAQAVAEPRRAVEGMDIVVTTTPVVPPTEPFLDAAWLSPGAFTSMVDLGFSWQAASLVALDRLVTDDIAQAGSERLPATKAFAGEVADLVAGRLPARADASERTALVFAGIGLADVAVAAALHAKALERRIGKLLAM